MGLSVSYCGVDSLVDPGISQDIYEFDNTIELFHKFNCDLEKNKFYRFKSIIKYISQIEYSSFKEVAWNEKTIFELQNLSTYFFSRYIDFLIHGSAGHVPKSKAQSNSTSSFFKSGSMRFAATMLTDKNEAFLFHSKINNDSSGHKRGVMGGRRADVLAHEACDPSQHQLIMA
jgi:hypothetical protein